MSHLKLFRQVMSKSQQQWERGWNSRTRLHSVVPSYLATKPKIKYLVSQKYASDKILSSVNISPNNYIVGTKDSKLILWDSLRDVSCFISLNELFPLDETRDIRSTLGSTPPSSEGVSIDPAVILSDIDNHPQNAAIQFLPEKLYTLGSLSLKSLALDSKFTTLAWPIESLEEFPSTTRPNISPPLFPRENTFTENDTIGFRHQALHHQTIPIGFIGGWYHSLEGVMGQRTSKLLSISQNSAQRISKFHYSNPPLRPSIIKTSSSIRGISVSSPDSQFPILALAGGPDYIRKSSGSSEFLKTVSFVSQHNFAPLGLGITQSKSIISDISYISPNIAISVTWDGYLSLWKTSSLSPPSVSLPKSGVLSGSRSVEDDINQNVTRFATQRKSVSSIVSPQKFPSFSQTMETRSKLQTKSKKHSSNRKSLAFPLIKPVVNRCVEYRNQKVISNSKFKTTNSRNSLIFSKIQVSNGSLATLSKKVFALWDSSKIVPLMNINLSSFLPESGRATPKFCSMTSNTNPILNDSWCVGGDSKILILDSRIHCKTLRAPIQFNIPSTEAEAEADFSLVRSLLFSENYIFGGSENGKVTIFDIRNPMEITNTISISNDPEHSWIGAGITDTESGTSSVYTPRDQHAVYTMSFDSSKNCIFLGGGPPSRSITGSFASTLWV